MSHIPTDKFVFSDVNIVNILKPHSAAPPIDHVPQQAAPHVPTEIPPIITLPEAAIEHMSDIAKSHLPTHIDWII